MSEKETLRTTFETVKNCIVDTIPCTQKEYWRDHLKRMSEKDDLSYDDIVTLRDDIELNVDVEDRICIDERFFSEEDDTPSTIETIETLLERLKLYEENRTILDQINHVLKLIK